MCAAIFSGTCGKNWVLQVGVPGTAYALRFSMECTVKNSFFHIEIDSSEGSDEEDSNVAGRQTAAERHSPSTVRELAREGDLDSAVDLFKKLKMGGRTVSLLL